MISSTIIAVFLAIFIAGGIFIESRQPSFMLKFKIYPKFFINARPQNIADHLSDLKNLKKAADKKADKLRKAKI